jgi:signal peptidase I
VGPEDLEIETLMDNGSDRLTGEQRYSLRRSLRELLLVLLAAALLAGGSMFFFRAALVRGSSMEPTLRDGDCIFVQTAGYHQPQQGDIVAIRAKDRQGKHLIKRIIAREGDTVQIDFEAGMVFVNGQLLEEPYINEATTLSGDIPFPVTVPPGCFFVLGDNRNHSQDSRSSALGFVPLDDIEGRAVFRFAPLSRFGPIEDRRP